MKTFTLAEAQALLPVLESLLKRAMAARQAAAAIEGELQQLNQAIYLAGGLRVDVAEVGRKRTALDASVQQAKDTVAEIDAIGVQVKDLDIGLLDFPCLLDDEVVLLCWKLGEGGIAHWHRVEDGFRGRQPVDERFRRARPEKPN